MSDPTSNAVSMSIVASVTITITTLTLLIKKGLVTPEEAVSHFSAALASLRISGATAAVIEQMESVVYSLYMSVKH